MNMKRITMMALLTLLVQTVMAQSEAVQYWHHSWKNVSGQDRVTNYSSLCNNYKVLDASTSLSDSREFGVGDNPEWDNGGYKWVVVKGEVTISRLIVKGEGHLILTDGCRLVCSDGVVLQGDGNSLSIYSQSSDDQEGRLEAKLSQSKFKYNAAIGCIDDYEVNGSPGGMGTLVIHGGVITATANNSAAGIGGGEDRGIQPNGSVTIYGGKVTATGGFKAAGIGGGNDAGQGGPVTIYGGTVTATGGEHGAGIGGGYRYSNGGSGGQVKIYGGNVTARGGHRASAIGAGENSLSDLSSFTMEGGTVHASSDYESAICGTIAIRGGELIIRGEDDGYGLCGSITEISNATVDIEAAGGPGISNMSGTMTIRDSNIRSIGGKYGAGITGFSQKGIYSSKNHSTINIISGTVYAKGGAEGGAGIGNSGGNTSHITLNISGGMVTAIGQGGGAGIGGGLQTGNPTDNISLGGGHGGASTDAGGGAGIDVNITGGTVIAQTYSDYAQTIGAGKVDRYNSTYGYSGELHIGDNMSVKLGTSEKDATLVNVANRTSACRKTKKCVKIEPCDHTNYAYYTYNDEDLHTKHCTYCNYTEQELHTYDKQEAEGVCVCGKKYDEDTDTWMVKFYEATSNKATTYDEGTLYRVVKGQKLILPPHKEIDGLTFMGWLEGTTLNMPDCEMRDVELLTLKEGGMEMTPESDKIYYARYRCQYDAEWTWSGDGKGVKTAKVTVTWRNGDETLTDLSAIVYNHTKEPTEEDTEGKYHYNATAAWQKKDGVQYQFTDQIEIPYVYSVQLKDNASNESVLANNEGNLVRSLTLYDRTFYHDGSWNTLCLPFSLSAEQLADANCPLYGATLKKMASAEFSEGTLTLNFDDVTAVEPGMPYLVKWNDGGEVSNPTFTDVFIASWQQTAGIGSDATFYGYYSPITLEDGDRTRLYMGSNNTLYYPADDMTVGSCRGIFQLHGITAGDLESGEVNNAPLRIVLNLDDAKGDATAISAVSNDPVVASPSGWFTLDGRRLADKPTLRGIYLHNGKKIIIP
ncbi:MAG: hypothetical protein J6M19_05845 [Bacteroidaceae bacterium]|nr:hypothetical protein [Bacteroidaceae bacterium]